MKRHGILHPDINHLLASTGHTDFFTICDRGFPIAITQRRIDLALTDDVPRVMDVLRLVEAEFRIDRIIVAEEAARFSPDHLEALRALREGIRVELIPHLHLKRLGEEGRATIRTGDTTPYTNIIVVSG